ncbi:hypothetical protein FQN57_000360 [Myotisia sp. PD_48]|nr:hypothetical protein FQN57_000360 [Myotisia sp. PD_48]
MPTRTPLSNAQLDALANTRRITFPNKPSGAEPFEDTSMKVDEGDAPIHAAAPVFYTFRTHVKIFAVSTGDDPGNSCELQGHIRFSTPTTTNRNINIELPVKSSWATENNGLGRFLAEYTRDSVAIPANFSAFLLEDDIFGDDIILNWGVDWTNPANLGMADGRAWTLRSWNTGDSRFRVTLWFRVTQLS